ncbi:hypothetical protein PR048_028782 [Dryococelus australis]|uniref:Uncharacterized protein n=1 Tax=Dryococelus australis TaxID=614101 RepID=A0ABQ9GF81_9NEOP|nr:hypothetical protein PR048_028782 [Dryococelus australis]
MCFCNFCAIFAVNFESGKGAHCKKTKDEFRYHEARIAPWAENFISLHEKKIDNIQIQLNKQIKDKTAENREKLTPVFSLCVRYVHEEKENFIIHGDFLKFIPVYDVCGSALVAVLL